MSDRSARMRESVRVCDVGREMDPEGEREREREREMLEDEEVGCVG